MWQRLCANLVNRASGIYSLLLLKPDADPWNTFEEPSIVKLVNAKTDRYYIYIISESPSRISEWLLVTSNNYGSRHLCQPKINPMSLFLSVWQRNLELLVIMKSDLKIRPRYQHAKNIFGLFAELKTARKPFSASSNWKLSKFICEGLCNGHRC